MALVMSTQQGEEADAPPLVGITRVTEYPLAMGVQTHEIIHLKVPNVIIISQQAENCLLKVRLDKISGHPVEVEKLEVPWEEGQGPHGLLACKIVLNSFWCSLQFGNEVVLLEMFEGRVFPTRSIRMPTGIQGPHCMVEDENLLWVTCKDTSHLVSFNKVSGEATAVYPTSPRPIFVATTTEHVYCSLDQSSRVFCLDKSSGERSEVSVEAMGRTPVGLVTGPDGNAWVVLLEGAAGTFGRFTGSEIQWLRLRSSCAGGLIHLVFDGEVSGSGIVKLFLLGSSMAASSSPDIVAVVQVELHRECESDGAWKNATPRVVSEKIIHLPTQDCGAHRVMLQGSRVFVTELKRSKLAFISCFDGENNLSDRYTLFGDGFSGSGRRFVAAPAAGEEAARAAHAGTIVAAATTATTATPAPAADAAATITTANAATTATPVDAAATVTAANASAPAEAAPSKRQRTGIFRWAFLDF